MPSLTSFVLISLALVGSVNAEDCSAEALKGLAGSSNLAGCTADTGLSVVTISAMTEDDVMAVCKSSSCMALMDDISTANLGDCTIPGSNVSVQSDILDQIASMCSGSGSMGSMASVGSSSSSGVTNVGDKSSSSDKATGSSGSSSTSAAATVTVGLASAAAVVAVTMLL